MWLSDSCNVSINKSIPSHLQYTVMGILVWGVSPISQPPKATSYAEMLYNAPGESPFGRNSPSPPVMEPQAAVSLP